MSKVKCKHSKLDHIDTDMLASNKVYDDKNNIVEYDDFKLYVFVCQSCGDIIVKNWLRSHFKRDGK